MKFHWFNIYIPVNCCFTDCYVTLKAVYLMVMNCIVINIVKH